MVDLSDLPLFDLAVARSARDTGIQLVLERAGNMFVDRACVLVESLHAGETLLAEQWRKTCVEHGVQPHHPNAWGGLTRALVSRGIICPTGQFSQATATKNHGHRYELWHVRHTTTHNTVDE